MTIRDIVIWPDARLSVVCDPIDAVTSDVHALARDMMETMYAAPGRGLAGPQVGVMKRIFVTDFSWKDGTPDPLVFINPEILQHSETLTEAEEGCLSIPGVTARVPRPDWVHMEWSSLDGARLSQVFSGFAAVCVQHELDHLNGLVTFDRVPADERDRIEMEYAS